MDYGEAFRKLGYTLVAPRSDWTAEKPDGICLTLWRRQIDWTANPIVMDTRLHGRSPEEWNPAGNNKRRRHLAIAAESFAGWVDAIIVDGTPGESAEKSTPWNPKDRKGLRWRVRDLDPVTGHFTAEALLPS